jgi:hypothetical protein
MDSLLDVLMTFAVETLKRQGEFYPFAGFLPAEGGPELLAVAMEDERPRSSDMNAELENALRTLVQEGARAGAIATDVRLPESDGDAIRVHVEHVQGDAVDVFMPYTKKMLRGFDFGDLFAGAGERVLFP